MPPQLLDRVAAAGIPRVQVERAAGEGWIEATALAAEGPAEQLANLRAWAGVETDTVAAALFLDSYAWGLSAAAAAGLLLQGELPDLRPDNVSFTFAPFGRVAAVDFHDRRGSVPGDAPSDYRAALVAHLDPLIARLAASSGRSRSALWRGAGDMSAWTLAWCANALGDHDRGVALVDEVFRTESPLGPPRSFVRRDDGSVLCRRQGCCLWLRTPGGSPCAGCPVNRS